MLRPNDWFLVPVVSEKQSDFIFNLNCSNNIVLFEKSKHVTLISLRTISLLSSSLPISQKRNLIYSSVYTYIFQVSSSLHFPHHNPLQVVPVAGIKTPLTEVSVDVSLLLQRTLPHVLQNNTYLNCLYFREIA